MRSLSLLFALLAIPVAWWAGRTVWGTQKAALVRGRADGLQPVPGQYAQEARMYSLVALLAIPATVCFLRAYALDTDNRRPWIAGFAVSVALALYTHNWPIFFRSAAARRVARAAGAQRPSPRVLFRDGAAGLRRRRLAVPAVGADDALPGRAHGRAVGRRARAWAHCSASPA